MSIADIINFDFVTLENKRYKINPQKATNTFILNAVLHTLKNEGYTFFRLFEGGCIFATK